MSQQRHKALKSTLCRHVIAWTSTCEHRLNLAAAECGGGEYVRATLYFKFKYQNKHWDIVCLL